jgi:hypothetical protein
MPSSRGVSKSTYDDEMRVRDLVERNRESTMDRSTLADVPLSVAAHRLGVSWAAAWKLVLTGDLDGERVGGRWVVSSASVDAYLARPPR